MNTPEFELLLTDLIECVFNDRLVLGATPNGRPHDPNPEIDIIRKKMIFINKILEQDNERLKGALNNIVNPIAYLQNKAKEEGGALDGMMALQLSKSSSFLQGLAKDALAYNIIDSYIIDSYNDYWNQVKYAHIGNGWISIYKKDWGDIIPKISKMELQHSGMFWRLDSLRHLPDLYTTLNLSTNGTEQ